MKEIFTIWMPIESPPFPIDLEALIKKDQNLKLIFFSENAPEKKLQMTFQDPLVFREIGDEYLSHFWHEVELDEDHAFFIVKNSAWLDLFHQQSENEFTDWSIQHYAIWTTESWIDVLCPKDAEVRWMDL